MTNSKPDTSPPPSPREANGTHAFRAPYAVADEPLAAQLLAAADLPPAAEARVDALAGRLVAAVRSRAGRLGALDDFLREYALSTEEGLALMALAEALLRVPDDATADRLIADKLAGGQWSRQAGGDTPLLVTASAFALGLTARMLRHGEAETLVATLARRLGTPAVRRAARQAMQLLGTHFVLGRTIDEALARASHSRVQHDRYSFDMLGEGARTAADADAYAGAYARAIRAIGVASDSATLPGRHGISVKLSALHPRYEPRQRGRVLDTLVARTSALARQAKRDRLNFTLDAEEADRLELSLDVFDALLTDPELAGWDGLGLAVQAYQKRAAAVLDHVIEDARRHGRRLMLRLVKGAYWDTEIKRAQERGLDDYPVFTRKPMTDLNYMACARKMLAARDCIYPQFATHNALTVATIIACAGGVEAYEFQRLHGMGESLYRALREVHPDAACRIYAPVGTHRDLLAYLVRRLLENGANSSFVARLGDPNTPFEILLRRPQAEIATPEAARSTRLPLPRDLHRPERRQARGIEFGAAAETAALAARVAAEPRTPDAGPGGRVIASPIDGVVIGTVVDANAAEIEAAARKAVAAHVTWSRRTAAERAACLDACADRLEASAPRFLALLQREAGKTLDDAVGEWREAIDFCRYYAARARQDEQDAPLPGPTGEDNRLSRHGRGVFVCISPWNFPLSIFLGQVAAALVAGNAVLAKPAEQTPLIAREAVALLHAAGVPHDVVQIVSGDGAVGAMLVARPETAGVAMTGSTETALAINRSLAARVGPIVPLIAETGGINAMIVDATALPEQVCDDVIASAFRSAGQRCSALRLLCVQADVADRMIEIITGAARALVIGDPRDIATDIGPVIDADAKAQLDATIAAMRSGHAITHHAGIVPSNVAEHGCYVAPHIFEIAHVDDLDREVFGPVLHVVRYEADALDAVLDAIAAKGFGLTLGIHSRIDTTIEHIIARRLAGNIYVNRSMIGAVVGTQPFGGFGLSGTGPKAGGPDYLARFRVEQVVSINTAAAGGNASLIASA